VSKVSGVPVWRGGGVVFIGMASFVEVGCVAEMGAAENGDPDVGWLGEVTRQVAD